jgi:hypothetical protein
LNKIYWKGEGRNIGKERVEIEGEREDGLVHSFIISITTFIQDGTTRAKA